MDYPRCNCHAAATYCQLYGMQTGREFHAILRGASALSDGERDTAIRRALEQLAGPGLVARAFNFSGAVAVHLRSGRKCLPDALTAARLAVCHDCGFYSHPGTCRHSACGCNTEIKATWVDQRCPLNKWPALPLDLGELKG